MSGTNHDNDGSDTSGHKKGRENALPYKTPRSVLVVVHTSNAALLMERVHPPGFWQSVTGSLEMGESYATAAHRELHEETGIQAGTDLIESPVINRFPIHPAWRHRYAPEVMENEEHVFHLYLPEPCTVTLNPKEHHRACWLPIEEAIQRASSATNRAALQAVQS